VSPVGRLAEVGPDVLLDERGERGFAHVVFPVHAGVDQHIDVARLPPGTREAGSRGGIGQAARGGVAKPVGGQRVRGLNACAHSCPPGYRW
jgi:hypothetical protein